MMQAIRNQMAWRRSSPNGAIAEARAGIVRSYDPGTASARVEFVDRSSAEETTRRSCPAGCP
ncbi:hypothetical protein BKK79_00030 [Cupriavidus sp. USMAA2-4]|uniref:hypothetical protein n=1 Tax=Cupriavidus sp. USMAA2-4 TaxID=876364 RepID=UPI0008A6A912|nr:hypothetical protein [Cupriavidus sp. USMAA2-4]AOY90391.1 hypothetical protein BKK79_00030 [Cupriavidus sp. USMAA2-4]